MGKVLIIDDEKQILGLLSRIIGLEGYEVLQAATCKAGLRQMEQHSPEVVLCDVFLPDGNGVDLVSDLKKLRPLSEIILLTAHGNIPDGVQAIKNGAFDYITKGDDNNKIIPLVAKAMEKASAAYQQQKKEATFVGRQYSFDTIVGKSPAIQAAIALAQKVSATEVPVLLTGETGTGKEVFAQSIHQHSSRKGKSFVAINLVFYTTPEKPMNAIASKPAVIKAIGVPCIPFGIFTRVICSRNPANNTSARPKPRAVENAYTTPVSRSKSFWITRIAIPKIQQFVVIHGRNTPSA